MSDYAVVNPATGETVKEYPTMSDAELEAAIASADACNRGWLRSNSVKERSEMGLNVGDLHMDRID